MFTLKMLKSKFPLKFLHLGLENLCLRPRIYIVVLTLSIYIYVYRVCIEKLKCLNLGLHCLHLSLHHLRLNIYI